MDEARRAAGLLGFVLLAFASTGCGIEFVPIEAQDAWSARGAALTESMLPPHETWVVSDRPSFFHDFFRAWDSEMLGGHVACGSDDDACAARLRSAPVHAGDWQNRFPIF